METIHINDLPEWRKNNPDVKTVKVDHGPYGKVIYTFNHSDPQNIPPLMKIGAYDGFGNFHFIDDEGTYHKCLTNRTHFGKY
jgi:hypothetical protein